VSISSSTSDKNYQLEIILAIIVATLGAYLFVLIAVGTFGNKKIKVTKNLKQDSKKQ
jgi:hypothetical protein